MYPVLLVCFLFIAVNRVYSQKAISFDSPGDYFEIPHDATLAPSQFTIEFWIKMEDIGDPAVAGGEQTIMDKRDGNTGFNFRLAGTSFPLPLFAIVLPGDVHMYSAIRWNIWHHVAITQDANTLKIYLDGELKGTSSNSYASNTTSPLRIGEFLGYPGMYLGLRGDIDDIRIWNFARSQSEIQGAMHRILSGLETGLAAYWTFDSDIGPTIGDLTSNGNDGVLHGNATLVTSEAPIGFTPPPSPVGLRAYGGEDFIELTWKPGDEEIISYQIFRGDSLRFLVDGSSLIATIYAPDFTYTDNSVTPGKDYYYCLRASDGEHSSQQGSISRCRIQEITDNFETGVYYYPWYGPSEGMHEWLGAYVRNYLIPQQPPMLGHYSSRDPLVISQHLEWMEACGIDFIVASWWGQNSKEDVTIRDYILNEIEGTSVKFSVYYESAKLGLDQGQILIDNSNKGILIDDFNYIADTYFDHPNFLRINDKPVVFLYLSSIYTGDYEDAFTTIRSDLYAKGYELFLIGDEVGWSGTSASHMQFLDAVSPYIVLPDQIQQGEYPINSSFFADISVKEGEWENVAGSQGKFVIPDVNPGFNNRPGSSGFAKPRQIEAGADGTSMLEEYIKVMRSFVEPTHKMIMITSWNEWHEDTQVEPTIVTAPTSLDNSASGDYYTWDYTYEGYGYQFLEVIRELLAGELPPIDFTDNIETSLTGPVGLEVYPNPFRAYTAINYSLLEPGIVTINVYDMGGSKITSILGEYKQQGVYHIDYNTQFLEKGVYILQMKTRSVQVVRKILKL